MIDNLKYLLCKISLVRDKIAIRKSQEETFNIFTTLLKRDDEVHLHSRFISTILDPKGTHKFREVFLHHFLHVIDSAFSYELSSLEIIPSEINWTEYKEIDVLMIDRRKQTALILENKINARDANHEEEGQLERYYRRIMEEDRIPAKNIEVYYLRPNRNTPPSDYSVSKSGRYKELPEKVRLISYEQEIDEWLRLCIKEASTSPFVRETLNQYLKLINDMANNSEIQDRLDLINTISTSEDTLQSAKFLLDNFCHVQWHTIADFFTDLCYELGNRGYKVVKKTEDRVITDIVFGGVQKRRTSITVTFENTRGYRFTIGSDPDDALYFGMASEDNKGKLKEIRSSISANKNNVEDIRFDDGWEFWCYFDVPEDDDIYLWDFKKPGTFSLIRKENRIKSIKKHLDDIENVIMDLFS